MTGPEVASLIDAHAAALRLFARQWCESPDDAVQDAFCKLVTCPIVPDDAAAWLFRTVRNAAIDRGRADARRKRRERLSAKPERWFEERAIAGMDAAVAIAALDALPGEQREIIVARLWGGLTLEQAAAAAGCAVSSAHRRYEAGIEALRERLNVPCPKT
jgi:RNA polymerase sigma factor (sigma-70 family)